MTYYGGKELAAAFRTVRENTIKIAEEIPENQYNFKPAPDTRSIAQTLAHIGISQGFQTHVQGNKITDMKTVNFAELFQKFAAEESKPRTKAEIVAFLKAEGETFASFLEGLPESFLAEHVTMEIKSPFNQALSIPAWRAVLGIDGNARLRYVHRQYADVWVDASDVDTALANNSMQKKERMICFFKEYGRLHEQCRHTRASSPLLFFR